MTPLLYASCRALLPGSKTLPTNSPTAWQVTTSAVSGKLAKAGLSNHRLRITGPTVIASKEADRHRTSERLNKNSITAISVRSIEFLNHVNTHRLSRQGVSPEDQAAALCRLGPPIVDTLLQSYTNEPPSYHSLESHPRTSFSHQRYAVASKV